MSRINEGRGTQPGDAESRREARQESFRQRKQERAAARQQAKDEKLQLQQETRANMEKLGWNLPRVPDLDACPPGWDQDVWGLTLLFQQTAQKTIRRETTDQRIILAAPRTVIYALLEQRCTPFRKWFDNRQERLQDEHLRPFYLGRSRKSLRIAESWQEVVAEAIEYHFRTWWEDEYAADCFCDPEVFRSMIREVREKGWNWHLRQLADQREKEQVNAD